MARDILKTQRQISVRFFSSCSSPAALIKYVKTGKSTFDEGYELFKKIKTWKVDVHNIKLLFSSIERRLKDKKKRKKIEDDVGVFGIQFGGAGKKEFEEYMKKKKAEKAGKDNGKPKRKLKKLKKLKKIKNTIKTHRKKNLVLKLFIMSNVVMSKKNVACKSTKGVPDIV